MEKNKQLYLTSDVKEKMIEDAKNMKPEQRKQAFYEMVQNGMIKPAPLERRFLKISRNDKCHCGSSKKFKSCCEKVNKGQYFRPELEKDNKMKKHYE